MGENSAIGWCHHTHNLWWGCVEVSPACEHCYAREFSKRTGFDVWGKDADRRFFGDEHWAQPLKWNRRAAKKGIRERVFCMSMGDIGEERSHDVGRKMEEARERLWCLINETPNLDWLLLTKRAHFYRKRVPPAILLLPNVWPGVTVESPDHTWRVQELRELQCHGPKWVSYEPALEYINPIAWINIDWIVVGGESGNNHRTMDLACVESAVQARSSGLRCYVKQDSGRYPGGQGRIPDDLWSIKEFPEGVAHG